MTAVVFDCDGVLVDSEPLSDASWAAVLARYGYAMTAQDVAAVRGTTAPDTHAYFAQRAPLPPAEEFIDAVDRLRWAGYPELKAFPDAAATVRELAMVGIPLAVASSSKGIDLREKLQLLDLIRYFETVVGGDEVAAGKPAPDLYLAAAAGLEVAPDSCLAVEDTAIGADAAVAAGMRAITVARSGGLVAGHATVDRLDGTLLLTLLGLR
jgi:beta-phosphoglucomutase-like phosphatase (HAD superfamily)